jgi:hypothetical protein
VSRRSTARTPAEGFVPEVRHARDLLAQASSKMETQLSSLLTLSTSSGSLAAPTA